jgi:thioredoxin reductase (NADPH)
MGWDLMMHMRAQSERFGTTIHTETVDRVELSNGPPFRVFTNKREIEADTVIISTGAVARRLSVPGSGDDGYWNKGISACAVCDGAAPIFRGQDLVVIGGGDSAMEEATFLTRYADHVFVVHRREELRASKIMQQRARDNPKLSLILSHELVECRGEERLGSVLLRHVETGEERELPCRGMFFAIGHDPATDFLEGQLELDEEG